MEDLPESAGCAPSSIPASRIDHELKDMDSWTEAIRLKNEALSLIQAIPRPLNDGAIKALCSVELFLQEISKGCGPASSSSSDPTPQTPRPLHVAATAIKSIMGKVLSEGGLTGVPAACQRAHDKSATAADQRLLESILPLQQAAPGEPTQAGPPTGAVYILWYLTAVQRSASCVIARSVRTMPFITCSLSEEMIMTKAQHEDYFTASDMILSAYDHLFHHQRGDVKSLWSSHVNSAGRLSHPARFNNDPHVFNGNTWLGSVTSSRDVLKMGAAQPDHPLPDAQTLLLCFKAQQSRNYRSPTPSSQRKRGRTEDREQKYFYIDKEVIGAIALLMGDLCYQLSLHLGDLLPDLACGPHNLIPAEDLKKRALTLGLFFQYTVGFIFPIYGFNLLIS